MLQMSPAEKHQFYNTVNAVECHVCMDYCDKNNTNRTKKRTQLALEETLQEELTKDQLLGVPTDCRFKCPKDLNAWRACVTIFETITVKEKNTNCIKK